MATSLTARLEGEEKFRKDLLKVVQDYVMHGRTMLDYYLPDFDFAHDLIQCFATMSRKDYTQLAKGNPRKFILPIVSTHVHTMCTFLASTLFATDNPHSVDAGEPESESAARAMNLLLNWNAQQQTAGMYQLGWMWIENALTYNRGICYDSYVPIIHTEWTELDVPKLDEDGNETIDPDTGEPETEKQWKKNAVHIGSYCKMELVSPYEFFVDPLVPLHRLQEGRFCAHRFIKSWNDMKSRSLLPSDDPMYISPGAIERIKSKASRAAGFTYPAGGSITGAQGIENTSRTAYERGKITTPADARADSKDFGMVDCVEMWVRLVPKEYEIDERTDPVLFQVISANDREVLAVNESPNTHDQFPYSVMQPRPSPFYQFIPSWVMLLSDIQKYVDYLKNRHQEAVARTVGNVFIAKSQFIDIADFEDPDKEGKFIEVLDAAGSMPINDIIRQVPITDMTAGFPAEMKQFISFAEATSGANQGLQGQTSQGDQSATEFQSVQQNAGGRLGAIARLLSAQAIVPQTQRFVSNFQQYYDGTMVRRIEGEALLDMTEGAPTAITISSDAIQGRFDFRAHDGTLPGADSKKTAALSRAIQVMPLFPQLFQPGPTGLNPRKIFIDLFRATGMNPENYRFSQEEIQQFAQGQAQAQQQQAAQQQQQTTNQMAIESVKHPPKPGEAPPAPQNMPPGAAAPALAGSMPGPKPLNAAVMPALSLPSAAPDAIRPANA